MNEVIPGLLVGSILVGFGGWMIIQNLAGTRHKGMLFGAVPLPISFWFPGLLVSIGAALALAPIFGTSASPRVAPPMATTIPAKPTIPPAPAAASQRQTFSPYWVKNHRLAEMWSGPVGQQAVVSFGTTSHQFCSFQVVRPQDNARLYVLNPYTNNCFWIDADAIGPAPPPQRRAGSKPSDVNCTEDV